MLYIAEPHQYIIKIFKKKKFQVLVKKKKIKYKKFSLLLLNKFNQESREIFSLLSLSPISHSYKKESAVREKVNPRMGLAGAQERAPAASDNARTGAARAPPQTVVVWPLQKSVSGSLEYSLRHEVAASGWLAEWQS